MIALILFADSYNLFVRSHGISAGKEPFPLIPALTHPFFKNDILLELEIWKTVPQAVESG